MIPRPNPEALGHLEENLDRITAVVETQIMAYRDEDRLLRTITLGARNARRRIQYVRPMFQVMNPSYGGQAAAVWRGEACATCYDFSRSWNCPDHPEKSLAESIVEY